MATLTNTKIKDTYKSLLKVSDNGNLEASLQEITDGEGNASGVQLNTGGDLTASGTVAFGSLKDSGENITITKFVDEADGIGANDNDTSIPTSAAVKNYVDTNVTAQDLDFAGDSGTGAVDLDSQTFTIAGTANEIETSASGQTITIGLPNNVNVSGNLTVDTNTLFVESTNNRVGIGTSSGLAAKLDISNSAGEPALKLKSTNSSLFSSSKLYNDSDKGLDSLVYGSAYSGGTILSVGANGLALYSNTTTALTTLGAFDLRFGTNSTERMRIDSSGRVGIGTSSIIDANTKLQISNGSSGASTISSFADDLVLEANGNVGMSIVATNTTSSNVYFADNDSPISGYIKYDHNTDNFVFATSGAEALRISDSGNIGIGGTPSEKLTIDSGYVLIKDDAYDEYFLSKTRSDGSQLVGFQSHSLGALSIHANGGEKMRIDRDGKVGIGTSSPATELDISKDYDAKLRITSTKNGTWIDGDNFGSLEFYGKDTSGLGEGIRASIRAKASGTFGVDTNLTFSTSNGTTGLDAERMRIDSSGNVGIGGTPSSKLHVQSGALTVSGNSIDTVISYSNVGIVGTTSNHDLTFVSNSTERMRIDSSGNVGIGTASPSGASGKTLVVNGGSGQARLALKNNSTGDASGDGLQISLDPTIGSIEMRENLPLSFITNNTERMRIDSSGRISVGFTSWASFGTASIGVGQEDEGRITVARGGDGQAIRFYNSTGFAGSITLTGSSTAYNTSSDYRLKENVVPMEGALDRVDALKPSRFNFIADPEKTVDGFLAHEVAEVIPEAITGEKDAVDEEGNPIYQGIDQSKIVPLLVGAIKELKAEIESLKSQLNA